MAYFMVSNDKPEDNKRFAKEHGGGFPILSDPSNKMPATYGVLSARGYCNRWTFYIDKKGVIQKIDKKVKAASAGDDMVATMRKLKFPETDD